MIILIDDLLTLIETVREIGWMLEGRHRKFQDYRPEYYIWDFSYLSPDLQLRVWSEGILVSYQRH